MPCKIMILEVRFLLTNFDSTSATYLETLYLALNKINYLIKKIRGEIWALGDIPGPLYESLIITFNCIVTQLNTK